MRGNAIFRGISAFSLGNSFFEGHFRGIIICLHNNSINIDCSKKKIDLIAIAFFTANNGQILIFLVVREPSIDVLLLDTRN